VQGGAQVNEWHAQQNEKNDQQMGAGDDFGEHLDRYGFDVEL